MKLLTRDLSFTNVENLLKMRISKVIYGIRLSGPSTYSRLNRVIVREEKRVSVPFLSFQYISVRFSHCQKNIQKFHIFKAYNCRIIAKAV